MQNLTLMIVFVLACGNRTQPGDDALATAIGHGLVRACPLGDDPADEHARDACADKLGDLAILRDAMAEPFIWGGQQGTGYALERGTTRFDSRVWRRLYASTFMFGSSFTVELAGEQTILHMPVRFRGAMPPGAYPYPFWHSAKKWDAYSYATTIHLVLERGRVVGALRGAVQDTARAKAPHAWDGAWPWSRVSLYSYLLSPGNPHALALDTAYRALEARMREHGCPNCHAPDNNGKAPQLELLVYPNQALGGRHDIVAQLENDAMPPADVNGPDPGIADPVERTRLLELARQFALTGDATLTWETAIAEREDGSW